MLAIQVTQGLKVLFAKHVEFKSGYRTIAQFTDARFSILYILQLQWKTECEVLILLFLDLLILLFVLIVIHACIINIAGHGNRAVFRDIKDKMPALENFLTAEAHRNLLHT